ncbi:UDP-glucuronic acid decarboxylase family protein [Rhizobium sullae]|uniref:UDP-glucuronate decarboxylase n=1 Tax=Rhizobium sullae TaxID=50338 RepID=A0A4R3PT57_RHISU|nr:UDP-glucuronic acid decarboxylase family protein [Rhizobium sullae]TCU06828.1 UDP-glucuronate decarboxylase [Rhizobium sullae]
MSKRVVLAGAAGFLGSHLAERLVQGGYTVTGLDNFHTGHAANLAGLMDNKSFSFVEHDIRLPFSANCDAVMNFACPASPPAYQANAIGTLKINFHGTLNLLGLAKAARGTFFQASTSEIYGDPELHPQTENYRGAVNPIGPRACYDEGKRVAEALTFEYRRQHKLDVKVVRIFNTYGPRMRVDDGRVVSNFIVQALLGENITVYGDGRQTRSFCYVDDLVEGIVRLFQSDPLITGPMNIGNPVEFTIGELAELVIAITGSTSKIIRRPLPEDDPRQRCPDISLARQHLDWEPKIALAEGLLKTIRYFEEVLRRSGKGQAA